MEWEVSEADSVSGELHVQCFDKDYGSRDDSVRTRSFSTERHTGSDD